MKDYRGKVEKKPAIPKPAPIIEVREEFFRLIDFESEWTFEMNQLCKPFINGMMKKYFTALDIGKVLKSGKDVKEEISHGIESGETDVLKLLEVSFEIDAENNPMDFLALIYWEREQIEFDVDLWKQRVKKFNKMNDKTFEIARVGLDAFFTSKLPSIMKNSQIFLGAVNQMNSIAF